MIAWRKWTSPGRAEFWATRLLPFGPERLVVTETGRRVRLELFDLTPEEAAALPSRFGGEVRDLGRSTADWARAVVQGRPLAIRGRLRVRQREPVAPADAPGDGPDLFIPAGMAFGTGDHATTATCLRLLCDFSPRGGGAWSFLDVGCGTGILALAARKLGAAATGFDLDPVAVRTARENARLNNVSGACFFQGNLLTFTAAEPYDIVAANVYSEVLMEGAAAVWACVRARGGLLLVSGVLRAQADPVAQSFVALGAQPVTARLRGKWGTLAFRKG